MDKSKSKAKELIAESNGHILSTLLNVTLLVVLTLGLLVVVL